MYGYFNCSVLKKNAKPCIKPPGTQKATTKSNVLFLSVQKTTILRPLLLFQVSWRQNVDLKCEKPLTL